MRHSTAFEALHALGATSCSIVVTDATLPDNPIMFANDAFTTLTGYPKSEIIGRNCRFLQGPDTDARVTGEIRVALAAGERIRREILNYRKDGTSYWIDLTIDPIRDAAGAIVGFVGMQHETDTIHRAQEETARQKMAEVESRLASIVDHVSGYIYQRVMRTDGTIEMVYCSPSMSRLLGVEAAAVANTYYDYVHRDDLAGLTAAIRSSAAEMSTFREEFRLISASGAVHWMRSEAPPRKMDNGEIVWDGLALEISAEKRWQNEISDLALRDPLTKLLTREAWRRAIEVQLAATNEGSSLWAILHFDIAAFHDLNNVLGPVAADEVLREVARRLAAIAEPVAGIAARIGGDEFALMVPACADQAALSVLSQSAADALALPISADGNTVNIRVSIGASLSAPSDMAGEDAIRELNEQADNALRRAKQALGAGPVLYSKTQDDRFQNEAILAGSLEQAIAGGELELHYQPLVDITSGRIVSAEALVRWKHPTLGMQRPDLFISLAERMGLIGQLGRWVFEEALRHRKLWQQAGVAPPPISLNVSGIQLADPEFVALVEQSLSELGGRAADFELELTEGLLIEPSPQILKALHALRNMGFRIAIDDFGSGHATFRYLRDFPVDKLKIDQIFVRKLVLGSTDALIIRAVISLARGMGISFVAEGIETEMQREFLRLEGCTIGQGYLFSMPLVTEDFFWMLVNDARLPLGAPARFSLPAPATRPPAPTEVSSL